MVHNTLTIAGSDSGGGAGIQADLKTFTALGVFGASVITAVTAQNTVAVTHVHVLPVDVVRAQLAAVLDDIRIDAIKIGMLPTAEIIDAVSDALPDVPVVLDPVLIATSGARLVDDDALSAMRRLAARATVITPNLFEVGALLGNEPPADVAAMEVAAQQLGARAALVKGGHLEGDSSVDVLWDGAALHRIEGQRIATEDTHGSGCTLSSAIAAHLARGLALREAVVAAKAFVSDAIARASALDVGRGPGPLNHLHTP
ncbi:MAG: bifunctional hydroxymethylpyrimidine kinase/phosphomethylpyrimidine kinase [Deltaproteobacteria bacterium]|jgi:hydroxymethylpyrimidine/phosphomethylpyrimidine kinase